MSNQSIQKLKNQFDDLAQNMPEENLEFWFARDLQEPLGYKRWENFLTAINRAISSCKTTGYEADDHFRGVTKLIVSLITSLMISPKICRKKIWSSGLPETCRSHLGISGGKISLRPSIAQYHHVKQPVMRLTIIFVASRN